MHTRRIVAAIVAGVLTILAAAVLILYVGGADRRATRALEPQSVLVVVAPVARGTAADALGSAVQEKQLPGSAKAEDAVASVADLGKRIAAVDLVPGEQVLASRFVDPAALESATVPDGLQEVSVLLTSEQAYGGRPAPGDRVGVFLSSNDTPKPTRLALGNTLVTRVQGGVQSSAKTAAGTAAAVQPSSAPEVKVMVTLAVSTHDAEKVVWAAEHGSIWLSLQNKATDTTGSSTVTSENFSK
ncbi:Flp pilus assembly protein CpaB [Raineyella sp. LH-20]|uniref:Flp pilus assembly protein CpaB n=1 Tax=Raineyella sp. LH-20 TaxID=3081204 RepID=UPI0029551756|nr:RcpC/CpaB family pilus assembly protein [Raineyella sp. LH-20]WOP17748.1 RcpC/CpaB family pilus assembly protein [Raineyella sp. LH-20]